MPTHPYSASHEALARWYAAHGRRDLPWRQTGDPYAILVSEVMLQQTQVKTVLERYYSPFLTRFPTLRALAGADEVAVLKQWEGLGYYQRARNLHKAAKAAPDGLPRTVEALMALPGIGQNTAHAVAAFAFRQPVAVLEANVKRVVRRFFALQSPSPAALWQAAATLLNPGDPFDYNQAMMDIGALICTPKAPRCGACPLAGQCMGQSAPQAYDPLPKSKAIPTRERVMVLWERSGTLALTRTNARLLGGLYAFAQYEPGFKAGVAIGHVKHTYSHFKLVAEVRVAQTTTLQDGAYEWHDASAIGALPLSRADQKALALYEAFRASKTKAVTG